MTAVIQQLFTAMLEMGNEELDNSAIITVYEALTGTHLIEPEKNE